MFTIKQELRVGESVNFDNGRIILTLLEKSGNRARFDIKAQDDVSVKAIKSDNAAASIAKDGINLTRR